MKRDIHTVYRVLHWYVESDELYIPFSTEKHKSTAKNLSISTQQLTQYEDILEEFGFITRCWPDISIDVHYRVTAKGYEYNDVYGAHYASQPKDSATAGIAHQEAMRWVSSNNL